MSDDVQIVREDIYEEIASTFQCIQVRELDEALSDCGVADQELRKRICERFSFGMGNFFDQYWFRAGDKRYYPLLCFTETFLNMDTEITDLGTIYAPSMGFAFHEYAGGDTDWYFGDEREANPIEIGVVSDEDRD